MHIKLMITSVVLATAYSSPADALGSVQSGVGPNGVKWTASSRIIGQTSTGTTPSITGPNTAPGGGDPVYLAPNNKGYSGVVGVLVTLVNNFTFTCSGTLVGNRSVVTAAHCVSEGGGVASNAIARTQIFFQDDASSNGDERVFGIPTGNVPAGITAIDVSNYAVQSAFTGETVDQNDIAVLTLAELAPAYAQRYDLYTGDIKGKQFNVAGYGVRSSIGGSEGDSDPYDGVAGYRRQGDNVFDYAWGDEAFNGFYTNQGVDDDWYFGTAKVDFSYVADFDNGLAAQNSSCVLAEIAGVSAAAVEGLGFCDRGIAGLEVNSGRGDSGGGAFINGQLASVLSYGLGFNYDGNGDIDDYNNSSYGELTGYVPTFIHADFIRNAIASAVPEPATWMQMLLGFGMIGAASRRRHRAATILA